MIFKSSNQKRIVKPHDSNGFTPTVALISVLIMGLSFSVMISMITTQHKEGKDIYQKIGRSSLKYAILQTSKRSRTDNYHFSQSPGSDGNWSVTPAHVAQSVNQSSKVILVFTGNSHCGGQKYGDCTCANADTKSKGLWIACPVGMVIADVKWSYHHHQNVYQVAPTVAGRGACAMQSLPPNKNIRYLSATVRCVNVISL